MTRPYDPLDILNEEIHPEDGSLDSDDSEQDESEINDGVSNT